jgi:UDP-N-acetylmuramoyl-tripeptide--D-alanyl-D-alanine ligase
MNILPLYELYLRNPSVQTDTRKLQPGDLFFALKGDNFNGNKFAQQAIDAGAACAVIDDNRYMIEGKTYLVEDTLKALQELARHHRQQFTIEPQIQNLYNGRQSQ